jgi:hypothetical protein
MDMPPSRREQRPKERVVLGPEEIAAIAARVSYVGSPEHKRGASSFAGTPKPRLQDASICPAEFENRRAELTAWLAEAIELGLTGAPLESEFPRYVWYCRERQWFAARLTNQTLGQYKGWPAAIDEVPSWALALYE